MSVARVLRLTFLAASLVAACPCVQANAQLSITTVVALAIQNSPRVKMSQAEVDKARAIVSESKDVFIPAVTAGAGLGEAYGYSFNPPTLFTGNAQSLAYNASQFDYIRSARAGLGAATLSLEDTREAVAEDAALTFVALDRDQQREAVLRQESTYSARLLAIVQDRFDAGRDSQIDLTLTRLAAAQLRLASLRAEDETAIDRTHLARLMGMPPASLRAEGGFPSIPVTPRSSTSPGGYANAAVAAAFATAQAKQESAWGDSRYLYRPQLSFVVQYNRYATFTDSFKNLEKNNNIGANEAVFGVQISIPLYDRLHKAKASESAAEASRSFHEAETAQMNVLDGQSRLSHTIDELRARAEVAALEQQLSQQQLDILLVQLNAPSPGTGPQMTPKDEQNSRIAEREKYLAVVEATFQMHQAEINLLRQSGQLEEWLRSTLHTLTPPQP